MFTHGMFPPSSKELVFRQISLMLHHDQHQKSKVLVYLQAFLTMHCERLIRTFVYPNPMPRPPRHHIIAPSIPLSQSGAAQSHHDGATESATQSRSRPFSWTRNISGILHRRDRSDIHLRGVEVPCTAGQPRNYHAGKRKMPAASSYQLSNTHTTQTHSAVIQSTPYSPPAANTSSVSAVAGTPGTMGPPSRPHNTVAVWRARFRRSRAYATGF
ncbi:hypothetical protein CY34DRAFT_19459 [Suillus luteus UH-Slu-Lm8-n1]|uniref:Uncharacterized protein n=1 Tax=Suillus luteus UH-Slu-Lm8-n1 TaxID=930992 RepID=A0A0D0A173_9AGAM|nr:hypothetical protein CY34DRAFT_19459 [Suillus luteus UH-Slu-Lm8-n1]